MTIRREVRARVERLSARFGSPLALAFTAIAVAIRWALDPILGQAHPLVTLYGAVAGAVWLGGHSRGVLAAITGYLAADYLFVEPRGQFGFAHTSSFIAALVYAATAQSSSPSGMPCGLRSVKRTTATNFSGQRFRVSTTRS